MDIKKHREEFERIVRKYSLSDEEKAQAVADFLTKSSKDKVDADEFAKLFNMNENEARVFLSFIEKGIEFKEKHLDKK